MKKSLGVLICLLLILSLGFVSAGWFGDFWKKISGGVTEDSDLEACIGEGGVLPGEIGVGPIFGMDCCEGLKAIAPKSIEVGGIVASSQEAGLVCYPCGDRICNDSYEDKYNCPEDCAITCTDSDGGKNYSVQGSICTTIYVSPNVIPAAACTIDECIYPDCDGCADQLLEHYCENGKAKSEIVNCSNKCESGACVGNPTCTDSDGGKNYYENGTMFVSSGVENYISNDFCVNPIYCEVVSNQEGSIISNQVSNCPKDKYDQSATIVGTCHICGQKEDTTSCLGNDCFVNEFFCFGSSITGYDADADVYFRCPNGCVNGACIVSNQTIKCYKDSDCGKTDIEYYCDGDALCYNETVSTCLNAGTVDSYCTDVYGGSCVSCPNGCVEDAYVTKKINVASAIGYNYPGCNEYDVDGVFGDYEKFHNASSSTYISKGTKIGQAVNYIPPSTFNYEWFRTYMWFDTSSIPDSVSLTNATLHLYCSVYDIQWGFNVTVLEGTQGSGNLTTSSFNDFVGWDYSPPWTNDVTVLGTNGSFPGVGHGWFQISLDDTSTINKTGNTFYALLSSRDIDSDDPVTDTETVTFSVSNTYLNVTYEEPASCAYSEPENENIQVSDDYQITPKKRSVGKFKELSIRVMCKITHPFSKNNYNRCASNFLE